MKFTDIKNTFKGDLFGGITAGVIALPLALAFGVASGAGAAAGLYGAIFLGFFAAVFGGTKSQISGPTGPITVVLASIIAMHPGNLKLLFCAILLAGIFQIILGISQVGKFIRYIPYPVISGFMSGIGVIIILIQLNPLLGLDVAGTPIKTVLGMGNILTSFNPQSLLLGIVTLFIVFWTPQKISRIISSPLIALVAVTALSEIAGLSVKTIGEIPSGLPAFSLPLVSVDELLTVVPIAITIAVLGAVDSLLTSLVADSITKTRHDSDKELIGQGIGNIMAALFGGIAGAGATMRTVINIKSGGTTILSGVIHSMLLLVILLGAGTLASKVPMAVLAGILIKVGFDIVDYKFIRVIRHAPRHDLAVMALVFLLTVFNDLIFAVGAGVVLSCLLFASKIASKFNLKIDDIDIDYDEKENEEEKEIEESVKYKVRVLNIEGEFFFGSASSMLSLVDEFLGTECLVINCETVSDFDISAVFALDDTIVRLQDKGIRVMLILANEGLTKKLGQLGVLDLIGMENIFYDKSAALNSYLNLKPSTTKT